MCGCGIQHPMVDCQGREKKECLCQDLTLDTVVWYKCEHFPFFFHTVCGGWTFLQIGHQGPTYSWKWEEVKHAFHSFRRAEGVGYIEEILLEEDTKWLQEVNQISHSDRDGAK